MRFLEQNEIQEWCLKSGIETELSCKIVPNKSLLNSKKYIAAVGGHGGYTAQSIASAAESIFPENGEFLLYVTEWGIWPSSENWPEYYSERGLFSETRSLETAPGHLFSPSERPVLKKFLIMILRFGWDAVLICRVDGKAIPLRFILSHDEWVQIQADSEKLAQTFENQLIQAS